MAFPTRTRAVDTANDSLAVECPRCHLQAARFSPYCSNCGWGFWPSRAMASRAFRTWAAADPVARADAHPYDLDYPQTAGPEVVDYDARARSLGIHLFPGTRYPILICIGFFFLGFAAIPTPTLVRVFGAILGFGFFLAGVGGWWLVEDVKLYEENVKASHGEGH